jgi:hypothetical protein
MTTHEQAGGRFNARRDEAKSWEMTRAGRNSPCAVRLSQLSKNFSKEKALRMKRILFHMTLALIRIAQR